VQVSPKDATSG